MKIGFRVLPRAPTLAHYSDGHCLRHHLHPARGCAGDLMCWQLTGPPCCEALFSGWSEEIEEMDELPFEGRRAPGIYRQKGKGGTKQGTHEKSHLCICLSSLTSPPPLTARLVLAHLLAEPYLYPTGSRYLPPMPPSPCSAQQPRLGRGLLLRLGWFSCGPSHLGGILCLVCCTYIPNAASAVPGSSLPRASSR